MGRTQNRALVKKLINPLQALVFGGLLGIIGFAMLLSLDNQVAFWVALFGFIVYTTVYGYAKRHSPLGTLVGAFAGAVPPVVGYTAASGDLDNNAILLYVILLTWQMPHFYAIAIKRLKEYQFANIPVWPDKFGMKSTKINMVFYGCGFVISSTSLSVFADAGYFYLLVMLAVGLWWLMLILKGFKTTNNTLWAGHVFKRSLSVLMVFSLMIAIDNLLV